MAFLADILNKRNHNKLNFRTKPIGFQEERKELRISASKKKVFKKKKTAVEYKENPNFFLKLKPTTLPKQKITDIYQISKFSNFSSFYRLFQISPQKKIIKKEILRFSAIGITAIILLNLVGAYNAGINLKKKIEVKALGAYENLLTATSSAKEQDFLGMFESFYNTNQLLQELQKELADKLYFQTNTKIDSPLQNITLVLQAGTHLTKSGEYLAKTSYAVQQLPAQFMQQNNQTIQGEKPNLKITDKIKNDSGYLNLAMTEIENATEILAKIDVEYLPLKYRDNVLELNSKLKEGKKILSTLQDYIPFVLNLLGDRYPQRYMVLLQNNHESRATGGFIGSYLLVDINDGEITKFELKDVYEADGQFHEKVIPPHGLHKITEDWKMRDANYSPDFPTSAQQVMWFLEHEKGPTVDTVIAINQRIVENLLEKIGEVEMPEMDLKINAENFSWVFSFLIESKLSKTESPKQFLMDFAPIFKEKLLQPQNIPALFEVLQESIERKDLMAYSQNSDTATLIKHLGIEGKISSLDETFDYLQVVNTSIGGNKSDGFIDQKLEHNTNVDNKGNMINKLTITRKHTWYHAEDTLFDNLYKCFGSGKLEKQELKDILGFGGNKSLIRVYVPQGSQLITATGSITTEDVLIYEDLNKTVFAFEQPVIYTEREAKIILDYKLPHKLDLNYADNYKLIVQNQSGQEKNYFQKNISIHGDGKILENYPQTVSVNDSKKASFDKFLEGDEYFSAIIGRK